MLESMTEELVTPEKYAVVSVKPPLVVKAEIELSVAEKVVKLSGVLLSVSGNELELSVAENEVEPSVELAVEPSSIELRIVSVKMLAIALLEVAEEVLVVNPEEVSESKATVDSGSDNMDDDVSILERDDALSVFNVDDISVEVFGVAGVVEVLSSNVFNIVEKLEAAELFSVNTIVVLLVDETETLLEIAKSLPVEELEDDAVEIVETSLEELEGASVMEIVVLSDAEAS
jgi:hypothetical protein